MRATLPGTANHPAAPDCHGGPYVDPITHETLVSYLHSLLEKYDVSERRLTIETGLDKSVVYRILRGIRKPWRNQIILIALALGCDADEAQMLLRLGERDALRVRIKRDAVILYCIDRQCSIDDCQQFLKKYELVPLRE